MKLRESLSVVLTIAAFAIIIAGIFPGLWALSSVLNYVPEVIMLSLIPLWVWGLWPRINKLVGKDHHKTYLPAPHPVTLSSTVSTPLHVGGFNGSVTISNPHGNSIVLVGGFAGEEDEPYFLTDRVGVAGNGMKFMPGQTRDIRVTEASRLSAIAQRNGDIINFESVRSD